VYATSAAGQVTGFGAGIVDEEDEEMRRLDEACGGARFGGAIVIDDPVKPEDARSENVRERVNDRFNSTIRSRVNSRNTPIIIIMQRLHPRDLCGFLLEMDGNAADGGEWHVLSIPAIIEENGVERALWPFKHTLPELKKLREKDESVFDSQYMQNPLPSGDLAIPKSEMNFFDPGQFTFDTSYPSVLSIDPANTGNNFAAAFGYIVGGNFYVTEFICNNHGLDENIPAASGLIARTSPTMTRIEGNGGWVQTAKDIREQAREKSPNLDFKIYTETENKEARISAQVYFIKKKFWFRSDYEEIPDYRRAIKGATTYIRMVKDQDDDALDVLCDISRYLRKYNYLTESE
jgi:hypothetical protein